MPDVCDNDVFDPSLTIATFAANAATSIVVAAAVVESFNVDCKLTGSNDENDDDLPFVGVTFVTVAIVAVASTWVTAFSIGIIISVAIVVDEVSRLHIITFVLYFSVQYIFIMIGCFVAIKIANSVDAFIQDLKAEKKMITSVTKTTLE
uniref:Transmembrane protein n=1 Tax=Glossina palpalis gambiensis TaxID=67801 RepID=A0A1B0AXA1_9MUSC